MSETQVTNPIESMFATVKHRTYKTKGCGSRETYLAMTFKLTQQAQGKWRRINAPHKVQQVANGVTFTDGETVNPTADNPSKRCGKRRDKGKDRRVRENIFHPFQRKK